MLKLVFILSLFLSSFGIAKPASTEELRNMDFRLLHLEYEHEMEICFLKLDICELKKAERCWQIHEQCVINTARKYKKLLKEHGF